MRIEEVETTRWETSDNQTSDFRHQTGSVACGVCSTDGRWYGGGRFLDFARNDRAFCCATARGGKVVRITKGGWDRFEGGE